MKKLIFILLILSCIKSFSLSPKDTTKLKLNHLKNISLEEEMRRYRKLSYRFESQSAHLFFDSHYVDTTGVFVYNAKTLQMVDMNFYYIPLQEKNVEIIVDTHGLSLLIFVICGEDTFIYRTP